MKTNYKYHPYIQYGMCIKEPTPFFKPVISGTVKRFLFIYPYSEWGISGRIKAAIFGQLSMMKVFVEYE